MRITYILSFSLAAIATVLAAPAAQGLALPKTTRQQTTYYLTVTSKEGRLFHDRPIVPLPAATLDGTHPLSLPAALSTENITIHPPTQPVLFTLVHTPCNAYALRVQPDDAWISQYEVKGKDVIAMGMIHAPSETTPGQADCPPEVTCSWGDWDIGGGGEGDVLNPRGKPGEWDAVKTLEGRGWRVVWKEGDHFHHPVLVTLKVWQGEVCQKENEADWRRG